MTKRSRGAFAPEFCSRKNEKLRTRSRRTAPAVGPAPSRSRPDHKIRKAERRQTRMSNLRTRNLHPPRVRGRTEEGARRASSVTRSPVGVPPRRLRQRTNAAAQLQHALPGTWRHQALPEARLSQSSEQLADRSWCRPGVLPEPPENGSDEPPPAGTALAPAAGVTRRPSCKLSEIRDVGIRNGDKSQATVAISETVWQLPEGWSAATLSVLSLLAWGKTGCKRPQPRRSTFCATTQARP